LIADRAGEHLLSLSDVEDLFNERGVGITHETACIRA